MINIKFIYKVMWFVKRELNREVPTSYKEMNQVQFSALMKLVKGYITEEDFYCKYFDIDSDVLKRLDLYQLYKLTERVRIEEHASMAFVVKELGGLKAPADRLSDMSFQQFMSVDQHFGWYIYTENRKYLDMMLAALYIEPGKDFWSGNWDERQRIISSMKEEDLYPAVVNWMLIKNWLTGVYTQLFSSSPDTVKVNGKQKKQRPADWLGIFDAMVGDNLHLIDEYKKMPCMDALRYLNNKIKKQKHK